MIPDAKTNFRMSSATVLLDILRVRKQVSKLSVIDICSMVRVIYTSYDAIKVLIVPLSLKYDNIFDTLMYILRRCWTM